jgi:diaminohydroxyphosphoribosylaminopyrimidine deaminase/5-amino-6-(5-phosphoribosylamino)uracil reductase
MEKRDLQYMQLAMELAEKGKGGVNPNPLVGAVIVKDGRIIARGWHKKFGGPHAEINAFSDASESVEGATMYVTLEPCSHYGKTPPCSEAIIKNKISRVVIGLKDPNPLVAGRGINMLEEAGISVECGLLEKELRYQNRVFLKYIKEKTPWVVMKTAMTLDGKIAAYTGDSKWVSGEESRKMVHSLRNELQGIMVGVDTVVADNPELTCRLGVNGSRNPVRIVVDSSARVPVDSRIFDVSVARTIIATTYKSNCAKLKVLKGKGVEIVMVGEKDGRVDLHELMIQLGEKGIDGILLEGGACLNYSVVNEGLVDEVVSFIAPKIVGGDMAKTPVGGKGRALMSDAIELEDINVEKAGNDIVLKALVKKTLN